MKVSLTRYDWAALIIAIVFTIVCVVTRLGW